MQARLSDLREAAVAEPYRTRVVTGSGLEAMAENAPLRSWGGSAAICKEDAYQSFEEIGVGRRIAMRALEKAGAIRADKNSRRTKVIRLDGKCQRVIIVEMGGDP